MVFLAIFLVFDFLLVFFVFWRRRKGRTFSSEELNYIRSHWIRIIDAFEDHPKQAILDADKLLDYALGRKGFQGSLGEKLKKAGPRFSDLNSVWSAHKLRNKVAHELSEIRYKDAKLALGNFKRALNDLGAKL